MAVREPQWASTAMPRAILSVLLGSMLLRPSLYQPLLDSAYLYLRNAVFYRASTFETFWTVLVYAIIETTYVHRFVQKPHLRLAVQKEKDADKPRPKMRRPSRRLKEGIVYMAPLLLMDLTMIKKFSGVPVHEIALSGNYDHPASQRESSVNGNFLTPTLHHFTPSSPLQMQRALPVDAPSSRQLVLQLAFSFLIYDTLFFLFHLALHSLPLLRRIHTTHHSHAEINPQITNNLDIFERLGLVLLANFSLNIIGSHVLTRTLFVPIFVWLLVDIHSGLEQEWTYDKLLPSGWGAGSKRHSFHHKHGTMYFEPFFTWWDDALAWAQRRWP